MSVSVGTYQNKKNPNFEKFLKNLHFGIFLQPSKLPLYCSGTKGLGFTFSPKRGDSQTHLARPEENIQIGMGIN